MFSSSESSIKRERLFTGSKFNNAPSERLYFPSAVIALTSGFSVESSGTRRDNFPDNAGRNYQMKQRLFLYLCFQD
jgi:hypothetical protein